MDEHQRRVFATLLGEVDAFHRGVLTADRLAANLQGLVAAADIHDEQLLHDFWDCRNDLLMEVAPAWFDSDQSIPGGEARFREWVQSVLATSDDQRT